MVKIRTRVPISVGFPFYLLPEIDEIVTEQRISRSDYVVQAVKEKMEREKENDKHEENI